MIFPTFIPIYSLCVISLQLFILIKIGAEDLPYIYLFYHLSQTLKKDDKNNYIKGDINKLKFFTQYNDNNKFIFEILIKLITFHS